MANGANPWLSSAFQNTSNPNQDYQSYLEGLGMDIDPSKVGKFFGGIAEDYQQDVGMARAGFAQGMSGLRTQGQGQVMQLGGGQGLSSAYNSGFGRAKYGIQQGLQGIGQQYGQGLQSGLLGYTGDLQSAQRGMESSFRDVATGLLGRDSAGISWGGGDYDPANWGGAAEGGGETGYGGGTWNPAGWTGGDPNEGATHIDGNGQNWIFRGGRWRES
jgi:hypothetical protein